MTLHLEHLDEDLSFLHLYRKTTIGMKVTIKMMKMIIMTHLLQMIHHLQVEEHLLELQLLEEVHLRQYQKMMKMIIMTHLLQMILLLEHQDVEIHHQNFLLQSLTIFLLQTIYLLQMIYLPQMIYLLQKYLQELPQEEAFLVGRNKLMVTSILKGVTYSHCLYINVKLVEKSV